jgi:cytochrome c553
MNKFLLNLMIISSVILPSQGKAAEDFVYADFALHTRTLASSCAACHGTQGNAVTFNAEFDATSLAGLDKAYIVQRLTDFRSGARPATVMHRHANGLTLEEIHQLADYFSHQKKVKRYLPASQTLKAAQDE